ncbi:MAG: tryptophan synthase subunit alpha, partial [Armatimonadota bacterium]|nr:tryptophan synthase subunit alpha [Armatimonadota bacterium]MDR7470856.1 tryptophan synthase subunit alpha [Armatimonadota bacterium]
MSRITEVFARLDRPALVAFLMAGDPDPARSARLLRAAARAADILEVGVPFSDPIADGPTIQRAGQRALAAGMTLEGVLDLVRGLRRGVDIPVVLLTYFNPVVQFGVEQFCGEARAAGVDGLVVPDLPVDEADGLIPPARDADLDTVFLVAPTTSDARVVLAAERSRGFLYCVSLTGVTGARPEVPPEVMGLVGRVKARTTLPVCVGFGISTPEQAQAVGQVADGVIVGSALVDLVERAADAEEGMADLLGRLRAALATVVRRT